jgi:hypothetical protein
MIHPDNRLFCRLDGETVSTREQKRALAIAALNLLEPATIPVFDEATQTAVHSLNTPICILSLMDQHYQHFKASVGLSRLGLMNDLTTSRQFPQAESFCAHVVDSHQVLAIDDTFTHPAFAHSLLAQQYGVRAYLGVPLITSGGICIGTLAVMDVRPHCFTNQEVEFLALTARWSISEFERQQAVSRAAIASSVAKSDTRKSPAKTTVTTTAGASPSIASQLKAELLSQLTQELCTPLTSVMGMASVLTSEIYGPLTSKQKEYLGIIHHSGQYLLSLVNEILELSNSRDSNQLQLVSVDIEMLCQQAINSLEQAARRREQQLRLSVEPGRRIWMLDKDKVRQMLYHLIFSVIQASSTSSNIRIHVSYRSSNLTISVWVSHPWLGEGLPYSEVSGHGASLLPLPLSIASNTVDSSENHRAPRLVEKDTAISKTSIVKTAEPVTRLHDAQEEAVVANPHRNLGLLFSRQIAEMHNGQITIQSSPESGYRYVISLPQKAEASEPR